MNNVICKTCAAGYFVATAGKTFCVECPIETYIPATLIDRMYPRTSCLACPTATATATIKCDGCDAGKWGTQATATGCQDCVIGFYSPGGDVAACKECPKGYHGRDTIAQAQCTGAFVFLNVFCLYESV